MYELWEKLKEAQAIAEEKNIDFLGCYCNEQDTTTFSHTRNVTYYIAMLCGLANACADDCHLPLATVLEAVSAVGKLQARH